MSEPERRRWQRDRRACTARCWPATAAGPTWAARSWAHSSASGPGRPRRWW